MGEGREHQEVLTPQPPRKLGLGEPDSWIGCGLVCVLHRDDMSFRPWAPVQSRGAKDLKPVGRAE